MSKKIISNIFNYAAHEGAKSFMIEAAPDKLDLHYHFSGDEDRSFGLPKKLEKDLSKALRQVLKLAPDELVTEKYCKIEDKNFQVTFYLTIVPASSGEKIVINIIPKDPRLLSLKQLGLQKKNLKTLEKIKSFRSGLVLISSPDGQGKSTTLNSILQKLNNPDKSIYFLGSSLELPFEGISYLKSNKNNWAKVIKLDSEIIICEIESEEDFKNAAYAASTGRLVIATIGANSVWEALLAYLKLKLPLKLKLDSLKLILNQRLVNLKSSKRKAIGLFEILELRPSLKKYLLDSEFDKTKKNFWENLGRLAIKDGYEPLSFDQQKKIKDGLINAS